MEGQCTVLGGGRLRINLFATCYELWLGLYDSYRGSLWEAFQAVIFIALECPGWWALSRCRWKGHLRHLVLVSKSWAFLFVLTNTLKIPGNNCSLTLYSDKQVVYLRVENPYSRTHGDLLPLWLPLCLNFWYEETKILTTVFIRLSLNSFFLWNMCSCCCCMVKVIPPFIWKM